MVQTTYSGEDSTKRNDIIRAAQQRFGLYGLKKTSMMEIANDLIMSKGLLYYYFPDKEHLYKAVVEKEMEEFKEKVADQISTLTDPGQKLKEYVKLRLTYFRSLLNLSRFRLEEMQGIKSIMSNTWESVSKFEKGVIVDILIKGNEQGVFSIQDPDEITDLLFDLLRGIRMAMIKDRQLFYLEQQDYELLVKRSEMLVDIFVKGLMA